MELTENFFRGAGLPSGTEIARGEVNADPAGALALVRQCPAYTATPLRSMPELAAELGVAELRLKDERDRMGLGSFKALGAAYVIARDAADRCTGGGRECAEMSGVLRNRVYACASAGNHGLSLAAGARAFGAGAVVYLADSVPEAFAERLRRLGATVVRPGGSYEDAMASVADAAAAEGWILLSDSSWPGYTAIPRVVMEGYLVMGAEIAEVLDTPPTHILLQAGVGGLAAAMAAYFRAIWGDEPRIVVVEPDAAPCLRESIRAGRPARVAGPESTMGRLDCKEPSHLALGELARAADDFVTISDDEAGEAVALLASHGIGTTPSGAAGVAALQRASVQGLNPALGLTASSRVLAFITEGPEDQP